MALFKFSPSCVTYKLLLTPSLSLLKKGSSVLWCVTLCHVVLLLSCAYRALPQYMWLAVCHAVCHAHSCLVTMCHRPPDVLQPAPAHHSKLPTTSTKCSEPHCYVRHEPCETCGMKFEWLFGNLLHDLIFCVPVLHSLIPHIRFDEL